MLEVFLLADVDASAQASPREQRRDATRAVRIDRDSRIAAEEWGEAASRLLAAGRSWAPYLELRLSGGGRTGEATEKTADELVADFHKIDVNLGGYLYLIELCEWLEAAEKERQPAPTPTGRELGKNEGKYTEEHWCVCAARRYHSDDTRCQAPMPPDIPDGGATTLTTPDAKPPCHPIYPMAALPL